MEEERLGKTFLTKHLATLLVKYNKIDDIIVISYQKEKYLNLNNLITIYKEYNKDAIKNIYNQQKNNKSRKLLLIFEDELALEKINNDTVFKQIMLNGRHYNVNIIINAQYAIGLGPEVRANFDNVLIFGDKNDSCIKRAYEHYFGFIDKYSTFSNIINNLKPYESVFINENNKIKEIGYYKALSEATHNIEKTKNKNNNEQIKNQILSIIKENDQTIKKISEQNKKMYELLKSIS